jgi:heme exporter protein D
MMQFDSLQAIWSMQGHGPYVWSAYAIAVATLVALVVAPLRRRKRLLAELRAIDARRAARAQHASSGVNAS